MDTNLNRAQYFNTEINEGAGGWKAIEAHYIEGVGNIASLSPSLGNRLNIVGAINSIVDRPFRPPAPDPNNPNCIWDILDDLISNGGVEWDPDTGRIIPSRSWEDIVAETGISLEEFMERMGLDNIRDSYFDRVQEILRRLDFVDDLLDAVQGIVGVEDFYDRTDDENRFLRSFGQLMNDGRTFARGQTIFDVINGEIDMRVTHEEATFTYGVSQWHMTQFDILEPRDPENNVTPMEWTRPELRFLHDERFRLREHETVLVNDAGLIHGNEILTGIIGEESGAPYVEGAFVRFTTNIFNRNNTNHQVPFDFNATGSWAVFQNNTRIFAGGEGNSVNGILSLNPGWTTLQIIIYVENGPVNFTWGSQLGPIWDEIRRRWSDGQVHQMMAHIGNGRHLQSIESAINIALDRIGIEIHQTEEFDDIVYVRESSIITRLNEIRLFIGEDRFNNHNNILDLLSAEISLEPGRILMETLNSAINPAMADWDTNIHGPIPEGGLPESHLLARLQMHDGAIGLQAARIVNLAGELHIQMNEADFTVNWDGIMGTVIERLVDSNNMISQNSVANMLLSHNAFSIEIQNRTIDLLVGNITDRDASFELGLDGWLMEWIGRDFEYTSQTVEHMRALFEFDPDGGMRLLTQMERFNNFTGGYSSLEAALNIGPNGAGIGATIREAILNSGVQNLIAGTGNDNRETDFGWERFGTSSNFTISNEQVRQSVSGHALWFNPPASLVANFGIRRSILSELVPPQTTAANGQTVVIPTEYTFQLWVRSTTPTRLRIGIIDVLPEGRGHVVVNVGSEWTQVTHTFQITEPNGVPEESAIFSILVEQGMPINAQVFHHGLMFNKGALLPHWQPSSSDTAAQVNRMNMLGEQMNTQLDNLFSDGHLTPAEKLILRREFETIYWERIDIRRQYQVMRDLEEQIHYELEPEDMDEEEFKVNPMRKKLALHNPIFEQKDKCFNFKMTSKSRKIISLNENDEDWIDGRDRGLEDVFIENREGGVEEGHEELNRVYHNSLEEENTLDETFFIRNANFLDLEQMHFDNLWDVLYEYIRDEVISTIVQEIIDHEDGTSETIEREVMLPVMEITSYDVEQDRIREFFNAHSDALSQLANAINERLDRKIEHTRDDMTAISSFLAESRTIWTGESIMNIVSGTQLWSETINGQLTQADLDHFLTEDVMREFWADVPYELRTQLSALDNDLRNFEVRTRESLTNTFRNAGGINFIQNSVGWNDFNHWNESGSISVLRHTGMSEIGRNTAFRITGVTNTWQTVPTTPGQTYTISYLVNRRHTNTNFFGIRINESNTSNVLGNEISGKIEPSLANTGAWGEHSIVFQANSERTRISIIGSSGTNADITALMMNVGDIGLGWTPHLTEVYNTNIVMDANGIEVRQVGGSDNQTMSTRITPTEFRVDTSQNNVPTSNLFRANRNGVFSHSLRVHEGIWMSSGTVANNDNGILITPANNGWSFINQGFAGLPSLDRSAFNIEELPTSFDDRMDKWLDWEGDEYIL